MTQEELHDKVYALAKAAADNGLMGEAGILYTAAATFTNDRHLKKFALMCVEFCNDAIIYDDMSQQRPENN